MMTQIVSIHPELIQPINSYICQIDIMSEFLWILEYSHQQFCVEFFLLLKCSIMRIDPINFHQSIKFFLSDCYDKSPNKVLMNSIEDQSIMDELSRYC